MSKEETTTVLSEKPLTTIMNSDVEYLKNDIQVSDEYIDKILKENSNNTFKEDESILIKFLNSSISNTLKIKLIEKSETLIYDINKIEDLNLHEVIFNNHTIQPVWQNIIQIYQNHENKLPEYLIQFINKSYNELIKDTDFHRKHSESNHDLQEAFEVSIIQEDSITDEAYEAIIQELAFYCDNIAINMISADKIKSLINHKMLLFSQINWLNIKRLNNSDLSKKYIETYLSDFLTEKEAEIELEVKDYEIILSSNSFKVERQNFAEKYCENLIPNSKNLTNIIIALFDNNEMPTNLYNQVLHCSDTNQEVELLHKQIQFMTPENIFECISQMDEPYSQLALKQEEMIKFENTRQNKDFLELLHDKELIEKVELKKEKKLSSKKYLFTRRREDM